MLTDCFILRKNQGIPYYSCRAFESLSWLRHGFSTRFGADGALLNLNPSSCDSPARVSENRRRLLAALNLENAVLVTLNQTHSNVVHTIESALGSWDQAEGDALITNVKNVAPAVKTADCFPLLIVDPVHKAVGAVHSGWRGTLAGILPNAIREMTRRFHSEPSSLMVALGPGIRECCFEVGSEVAELFMLNYPSTAKPIPERPGKYYLNLAGVLRTQLTLVGVHEKNLYDMGACTCCGTREFFSWRMEGSASGRMMAVISIF